MRGRSRNPEGPSPAIENEAHRIGNLGERSLHAALKSFEPGDRAEEKDRPPVDE